MEDSNQKTPMLGKNERWTSRRGLLSRRYSENSLRSEFVSRLPGKVRSGVDLDSTSFDFHLSKTRGLTKGEKKYYERQFGTLKSFEEVDDMIRSESIDGEDLDLDVEQAEQAQHERAMEISHIASVALLAF